jgi:hypothetical protein
MLGLIIADKHGRCELELAADILFDKVGIIALRKENGEPGEEVAAYGGDEFFLGDTRLIPPFLLLPKEGEELIVENGGREFCMSRRGFAVFMGPLAIQLTDREGVTALAWSGVENSWRSADRTKLPERNLTIYVRPLSDMILAVGRPGARSRPSGLAEREQAPAVSS